jgi:uncharacterized protein YgbK (DUF1537 family)
MGVPEAPPEETAPFEVIALKCRTAPVAEAVANAGQHSDGCRQAGATRFFWKYCSTFDSTPEGNIGPVSEALMGDLGTSADDLLPRLSRKRTRDLHGQPLRRAPAAA